LKTDPKTADFKNCIALDGVFSSKAIFTDFFNKRFEKLRIMWYNTKNGGVDMKFTVDERYNKRTLLSYLKENGFSHATVSKMKRIENGMTVNGQRVTVRYVLSTNDILCLACEDESDDVNLHIEPVDLDIDIVYEDDDLVVVNKPYGMPTIPSHNHQGDTLANALTYRYRDQNFVFRAINRLDRNTSGTVLVAKNARGASILFSEMKKRNVEKTYVAVVEGEFYGSGIIDKPLCRTEDSIIVRRVCDISEEGAKEAQTEYSVLCSKNGLSVVRLHPLTGRTHQIRVHLASIGHPIVGDELYGRNSELIDRQALHAEGLAFSIPSDSSKITVTAPLPNDMKRLAELAGYTTE
jgi:23S rRNA pseudouridine1911/1915/1917 synthase